MPPQRAADARRERALGPIILARVPPSDLDGAPRVDLEDRRLVEACVDIKILRRVRRVVLHAIDAGSSPLDRAPDALVDFHTD